MDNAQVAKKIKILCSEKGVSVAKMLNESHVTKGIIHDLEVRDRTPSTATLLKIANYFDCSVDYLLGRTNNSNSHRS